MRIGFHGFAADCIITGEMELGFDRLKDHFDQRSELVVERATLHSLDDGTEVCVPRLELDRADVMVAVAETPRGVTGRRIRTVRREAHAQVGPYTVSGDLHELPGARPMQGFRTSRAAISFTDATVSFLRAGRDEMFRAQALLLNVSRLSWLGDAPPTSNLPPPTGDLLTR